MRGLSSWIYDHRWSNGNRGAASIKKDVHNDFRVATIISPQLSFGDILFLFGLISSSSAGVVERATGHSLHAEYFQSARCESRGLRTLDDLTTLCVTGEIFVAGA